MKNSTSINTINIFPVYMPAQFTEDNLTKMIGESAIIKNYHQLFLEAEIVYDIDSLFLITISLLSTDFGRNINYNNLFYLQHSYKGDAGIGELALFCYSKAEESIRHFCTLLKPVFEHNFMLTPKRFWDVFSTSEFGMVYLEGKQIGEADFVDVYVGVSNHICSMFPM